MEWRISPEDVAHDDAKVQNELQAEEELKKEEEEKEKAASEQAAVTAKKEEHESRENRSCSSRCRRYCI